MSNDIVAISAIIGLFLAGAIWNVARSQATRRPLFGRPTCGTSEATLPPTSWLPLFGFGTARSCTDGTPQSPRRLLFEIATAAYFALAARSIDDGSQLVSVMLFSVPLLVIFLVDSWTRLIFTNLILLGVALGIGFAAFDGLGELGSAALAMVLAALAFAGLYFLAIVIYRNPKVVPFGLGDVYLAAMIGSMVRLDGVVRALMYGIFLAGISLGLLLVLKKINRKQAVPYGPYLVLGALIVLLL
jgi:prepilin signal peptidase PulO-like enzyme (type II secretory pathway)